MLSHKITSLTRMFGIYGCVSVCVCVTMKYICVCVCKQQQIFLLVKHLSNALILFCGSLSMQTIPVEFYSSLFDLCVSVVLCLCFKEIVSQHCGECAVNFLLEHTHYSRYLASLHICAHTHVYIYKIC